MEQNKIYITDIKQVEGLADSHNFFMLFTFKNGDTTKISMENQSMF